MSNTNNAVDFEAYKKWMGIPVEHRALILSNALCSKCGVTTFAPGFVIEPVPGGDIVINGTCCRCNEPIARYVECEGDDRTASSNLLNALLAEEEMNFGMFPDDDPDLDYDPYENADPELKGYLEEFYAWLVESKLSEKTISKHMDNLTFYVLDYLQHYDGSTDIADGCIAIDSYLGYWFIHKCMWSSKTAIKDNAAGIKKFYKCMLEHEHVTANDYSMLCESIKENMAEWLENYEAYMNDEDGVDDWFW